VCTGPAHQSASSLRPHRTDVPSAPLPCRLGQRSGAPRERPIEVRHRAPPPLRLPLFEPVTFFFPHFLPAGELLTASIFPKPGDTGKPQLSSIFHPLSLAIDVADSPCCQELPAAPIFPLLKVTLVSPPSSASPSCLALPSSA
jgi:hypothetical protein